jgi:hypothetical protein
VAISRHAAQWLKVVGWAFGPRCDSVFTDAYEFGCNVSRPGYFVFRQNKVTGGGHGTTATRSSMQVERRASSDVRADLRL